MPNIWLTLLCVCIHMHLDTIIVMNTLRGIRVIASRILYEICLLIGTLAIRGIKLTLNALLRTKVTNTREQIRGIAIRRTLLQHI